MPKKENKNRVYEKTKEYFCKFKNIIVSDVKDISTDKIQKIRHEIVSLKKQKHYVVKLQLYKKQFKN